MENLKEKIYKILNIEEKDEIPLEFKMKSFFQQKIKKCTKEYKKIKKFNVSSIINAYIENNFSFSTTNQILKLNDLDSYEIKLECIKTFKNFEGDIDYLFRAPLSKKIFILSKGLGLHSLNYCSMSKANDKNSNKSPSQKNLKIEHIYSTDEFIKLREIYFGKIRNINNNLGNSNTDSTELYIANSNGDNINNRIRINFDDLNSEHENLNENIVDNNISNNNNNNNNNNNITIERNQEMETMKVLNMLKGNNGDCEMVYGKISKLEEKIAISTQRKELLILVKDGCKYFPSIIFKNCEQFCFVDENYLIYQSSNGLVYKVNLKTGLRLEINISKKMHFLIIVLDQIKNRILFFSRSGEIVICEIKSQENTLEIFEKEIKIIECQDFISGRFYNLNGRGYILANIGKTTPDNQIVNYFGSYKNTKIVLIDLENFKVVQSFSGHKQNHFLLYSCIGGKNKDLVICGDEESKFYIWNKSKANIILVEDSHVGVVNSIEAFEENGDGYIVSCSDDRTVKLWKIIQDN